MWPPTNNTEFEIKIECENSPSPKGGYHVRKTSAEWNIYRTRFLIKAKQLSESLRFVDTLGREHRGNPGDYLVESSDGAQSIAPRQIFEDIYVAMGPVPEKDSSRMQRSRPQATVRLAAANGAMAV